VPAPRISVKLTGQGSQQFDTIDAAERFIRAHEDQIQYAAILAPSLPAEHEVREANADQLANLGLLDMHGAVASELGSEVQPTIERIDEGDDEGKHVVVDAQGGFVTPEDYADVPPASKDLPGQAALERSMQGGLGTLLKAAANGTLTKAWRVEAGPKKEGEGPRGSTDIYNEGLKRIYDVVLNPNADLSTFLHESAHIFLDMMGELALRPDAPTRLRSDWAATLKYLGAKNADDLKPSTDTKNDPARLRHEKWATTFERYLSEGKAPSPKLEGAFRRYRRWMVSAYGDASKVPGGEINDDIRSIFDRLLATDQEIEEQQKRLAYKPPLAADVLGMTPEQFQKHLDANFEATEAMRQRLDLANAKRMLVEEQAWWKDELRSEREKAKDEYEALPARMVQQAMMNRGAIKVGPLDEDKVKAALGPDAKKLGKAAVKKGGADPQPIAEFYGYKTTEDMLKDLLALKQKNAWVNEKADQRMAERFPAELDNLHALEKQVLEGLHSEADAEYLEREILLLSAKMTVPGQPLHAAQIRPIETAREAARQAVESRSIRRLDAAGALAAERRAATKALKEAARGNYARAFTHYLERLTNFYMWKQLLEAETLREKFLKVAGELASEKGQSRLGKGSPVYRDEIASALGELGLGPEYEGNFNPAALVAQMEKDTAEGRTVVVGIDADRLDEIFAKVARYGRGRPKGLQYTVLNVGELRDVFGMLESVRNAARNVSTAIVNGKRVELQEAVDLTVAAIERSMPPLPPRPQRAAGTAADDLMTFGASLDASQLRIETILNQWFGGIDNYAWQAIGKPMQEGKHQEIDLLEGPVKRLIEASEKIPFAVRKRANEMIDGAALFGPNYVSIMESIGLKPMSRRWEFIELLKHMGNESNKKKALEGMGIAEQAVMDAFVKLGITKEEMDYVQACWDAAEGLKKPSFDLEERDTGIRPEEIEAVPFTTPWGQYRGGYHPVAYHPATAVGARQEASLVAHGYAAVGTNHNHLKKRVKDFTQVVSLDPYIIQRHIMQSVHDIAFRERLRSVALVVRNPEVHAALIRQIGEARTNAIEKWLEDVGQQKAVEEPRVYYATMQALRGAMSVSVLGYSFGNAFEDAVSGIAGAVASGQIAPEHWVAGMKEVMGSPKGAVAKYEAESAELRSRHKARVRELANATAQMISKLPPHLKVASAYLKDHAFVMQEAVDRRVSAGIYAAAKRQALNGNLAPSDEEIAHAKEEAEAMVRLLLPSSHAVDSAAILRNKGLMASMLIFHRFFSTQYNVSRTITGRDVFAGKGAKAIAIMGGLLFANVFSYAILGSLARGQGPDKGEPWRKWFARKMVTGAAGQAVFGGDISEFGWWAVNGGKRRDPRNNSIAGLVTAIGQMLATAADGDKDAEKRAVALAKAMGLGTGTVPLQFIKAAQYVADIETGRVHPRGGLDVVGGVLHGQNEKTPQSNIFTLLEDLVEGVPLGTGPN
jgi:hypothetical protein